MENLADICEPQVMPNEQKDYIFQLFIQVSIGIEFIHTFAHLAELVVHKYLPSFPC